MKNKMTSKIVLLSMLFLVVIGCKKEDPNADFKIASITNNLVNIDHNSIFYDNATWNFGDGETLTHTKDNGQPTLSHTYATVGNYTIKLTISNKDGDESVVEKTVTISTLPQSATASISSTTSLTSTKSTINFTLISGEIGSVTNYYLQLSKLSDFSVLEDVNHFNSGIQNEVEVNSNTSEKTIQNLIPDQLYYSRIKIISTYTGSTETTYSNTMSFSTTVLPIPTITAVEDQLYDFKITKSIVLDDFYATNTLEVIAARDAAFTDIVTLEARPSNNTYYKEPNTNLYLKVIATVNGKTSEKTIQYNTTEKFLTGNSSFNASGTEAKLTNAGTVLLIGNTAGEKITITFATAIAEGDEYTFQNGSAGNEIVTYTDASGTMYELNNNSPIAKFHVYKVTATNAYVRLGSANDADLGIKFQEVGTSNTKNIWGLIANLDVQ